MKYTLPTKAERDVFLKIAEDKKAAARLEAERIAKEKKDAKDAEFNKKVTQNIHDGMEGLQRAIRNGSKEFFIYIEKKEGYEKSRLAETVEKQLLECISQYEGYEAKPHIHSYECENRDYKRGNFNSYWVSYWGILVKWD